MNNNYLVTTAIIGALGIGLGAFGAHGLKPLLSDSQQSIYQTANLYHQLHALFLLALTLFSINHPEVRIQLPFLLALLGVLLFSGSLYLLACRELIRPIPIAVLGPTTPIGGLLLIAAWLSLIRIAFNLQT